MSTPPNPSPVSAVSSETASSGSALPPPALSYSVRPSIKVSRPKAALRSPAEAKAIAGKVPSRRDSISKDVPMPLQSALSPGKSSLFSPGGRTCIKGKTKYKELEDSAVTVVVTAGEQGTIEDFISFLYDYSAPATTAFQPPSTEFKTKAPTPSPPMPLVREEESAATKASKVRFKIEAISTDNNDLGPKPWRTTGQLQEYFNYGLNEATLIRVLRKQIVSRFEKQARKKMEVVATTEEYSRVQPQQHMILKPPAPPLGPPMSGPMMGGPGGPQSNAGGGPKGPLMPVRLGPGGYSDGRFFKKPMGMMSPHVPIPPPPRSDFSSAETIATEYDMYNTNYMQYQNRNYEYSAEMLPPSMASHQTNYQNNVKRPHFNWQRPNDINMQYWRGQSNQRMPPNLNDNTNFPELNQRQNPQSGPMMENKPPDN
eukprot:Platyproteum_vivax@DN4965_c0_g1_i1.p1